MAEPVTFNAFVSSEYVLSTAENFVVYTLLEAVAKGGGGANGARLPLNLGVVIDRCGSMYDERRLEFVVEAVKFLADNVAADDKIAVIAFADKAQVILQPDQIHNRSAVRRALDDIDLLEIGGGTQMALGMRAAIDQVNRNLAADRLNRVLVLTDGQTYEETACIDLASQIATECPFPRWASASIQRKAADANRPGFPWQVSFDWQCRRDSRHFRGRTGGLARSDSAQRQN